MALSTKGSSIVLYGGRGTLVMMNKADQRARLPAIEQPLTVRCSVYLVWLLTVISPTPLSRCCRSSSSVDWLVILVVFHQFKTNFPVSETTARVNTLPNSPHGGLMIGSSGSRVESMHALNDRLDEVQCQLQLCQPRQSGCLRNWPSPQEQ